MAFRHLDYPVTTPVAELGPAALDTLLERGDLDAWATLARALLADPHGPLAETVERLCHAHAMYGTSVLWLAFIERARAGFDVPPVYPSELRQVAGLTQREVGERMGIGQSDVSRLEQRGDVRLSTLQRYVEACGGTLRVEATVGGRSWHIALPPLTSSGMADDAGARDAP